LVTCSLHISHVVGIGEMRKIAAMAETYHVALCPHNPSGPVANAATLQVAACTPNFHVLETMSTDVPYRKEVTDERSKFEEGCVIIPEGPGLGIDINEAAILTHPYEPRNLRHYTAGALTKIRPDDAEPYF
jgi:galactonate dehydratase